MNIFILEDDQVRQESFIKTFVNKVDFIIVSNVKDAVDTLTKNKFDWIFLDYDLIVVPPALEAKGVVEGNVVILPGELKKEQGIDVAKVIKDTINKDAMIIIHSWSEGGAKAMKEVLPNKTKVFIEPFGTTDFIKRVNKDVLKEK